MIRTCVLLLAVAACDLTYSPEVGEITPDAPSADDPEVANSAKCVDGDPATKVSFSKDIRPLFARMPGACTGCHGASATSGFSVNTYAAVRAGGQVGGTATVVPGKPCQSLLLQKLGPAPSFGARMPYNGPPFYSAEDMALVRDWIAEGALDN